MTLDLQPRILVACVGNIFLGDDGFGVEVARRLMARAVPAGVIVKDFGIRGFDLAYALMDKYDFVILVDACPRGGEPGSVYVIEPGPVDGQGPATAIEGHNMNPVSVLRMVKSLGGTSPPLLIVGCEPADVGSMEEGKLGLSEVAEAAVDDALLAVETLISRFRGGTLAVGPAGAALNIH